MCHELYYSRQRASEELRKAKSNPKEVKQTSRASTPPKPEKVPEPA